MLRHSLPAGCLLLLCFALAVRAEPCAAPPAPSAEPSADADVTAAHQELDGLPPAARQALDAGRVVLLETVAEEKVLGARLVAVIDGRPEAVVDTLRDYDAMAAFPEIRSVRAVKGTDRDTLELTVKPHALLPPMDFTRAVEWSLDGEGGEASLGMSLLATTSDYVADQQADYRILPLEGDRSLVFYETRSTYAKLSFRQKVLRRMCESSEQWLADVKDRTAARIRAAAPPASAIALLSSGAVAAPLH